MKYFLPFALTVLCITTPCHADPLEGRAEINTRLGQDRTIVVTEFWAPLTQDESSVFYTDLRLMGDDQDSHEGNLGLGYREAFDLPVLGKGIGGVHGWIDRRITERGSTFHQATFGAEWMGDILDLKLNSYFGLSDERTYGAGGSGAFGSPYFQGSGVFITRSASGQIIEETLNGGDAEIGLTLPFLEDYIDNIRVYAGGYHFSGDYSDDVTGWRTRFTSDITSDFQIGARFQRDDERGSQGFLEATIRFPFGNKKSYRKEGLRSRLDESPERDVDIVTGSASSGNATAAETVAIFNVATDSAQKIIHVDNSAVAAGDGTSETPFNSLQAAEAAALDHNIIYVHQGNGTSSNQDQGITLSKIGQKLIGSGVPFYLDSSDSKTANGEALSGPLLIAPATSAPVITNAAGNGVTITADDVSVKGIKVDSASAYGIAVIADGAAASATNTTISNVETMGNKTGIYLYGANGGAVSASVANSIAMGNTQHGISVYDDTTDTFDIDLGGGAMGSAGRNILTGNALEDLSIDYDGRALSAQNNWWGQAGGPQADQIYFGAPLDDSLVGHWLLDETSGTSIASRIGTHTGTFVNTPVLDPSGGALNGAVRFQRGDTDYLSIPDYNATDTGNKLTVSYWVNPDTLNPTASHVMKWEEGESTKISSWGVRATGGGDELFFFIAATPTDNGDNYFVTNNMDLAAGGWTNVTFVYNGAGASNADRLKVYKDGTQVSGVFAGTIPAALNNTNENIVFGRRLIQNSSYADYLDGSLDDVRIYNGALTAGQVGEISRSRADSTVNAAGSLSAAP